MRIEEISIENEDYPEQLRNIYEAPLRLFVLGNKEILKQKGVAIVGSRKATEYGKKVALQFSKQLSENGVNIISGLAVRDRYLRSFGNFAGKQYWKNNCCFREWLR